MGFFTDALGRRTLLRLSLLGFIIISMMPVLFPDISVILSVVLYWGILHQGKH